MNGEFDAILIYWTDVRGVTAWATNFRVPPLMAGGVRRVLPTYVEQYCHVDGKLRLVSGRIAPSLLRNFSPSSYSTQSINFRINHDKYQHQCSSYERSAISLITKRLGWEPKQEF